MIIPLIVAVFITAIAVLDEPNTVTLIKEAARKVEVEPTAVLALIFPRGWAAKWTCCVYRPRLSGRNDDRCEQLGRDRSRIPDLMYPRYRFLKGLASREYFGAAAASVGGCGSARDAVVGASRVVVPGNV